MPGGAEGTWDEEIPVSAIDIEGSKRMSRERAERIIVSDRSDNSVSDSVLTAEPDERESEPVSILSEVESDEDAEAEVPDDAASDCDSRWAAEAD